jgi:hypothetical protein
MSDATPADAGVLSRLFNTTQQVGAAIGVALLSTLAAGRTGQLRQDGLAATAARAAGYRLAFAAGAGLALPPSSWRLPCGSTGGRPRRRTTRARAWRPPRHTTYRDGGWPCRRPASKGGAQHVRAFH